MPGDEVSNSDTREAMVDLLTHKQRVYSKMTKQRKDGYCASQIVLHAHCIAVKQADDAYAAGGWPEKGVAYPEKFL